MSGAEGFGEGHLSLEHPVGSRKDNEETRGNGADVEGEDGVCWDRSGGLMGVETLEGGLMKAFSWVMEKT